MGVSLAHFDPPGNAGAKNTGRPPMSDPEMAKLRELLAARPRITDVHERRRAFDANAKTFPVGSDIVVEPVSANGVRAEWAIAPGADANRVVIYCHGGGYVFGSIESHRHLVVEIGRKAGMRTLALDYRLAPEHPFPAPVEDALAAYRYVLDMGIKPQNIAIAGDSAGGGLVVAAMVAIRDAGLPLPACGWCISPWVDMEALGGSFDSNAHRDPTVQRDTIQDIAKTYLAGADPRSPLAAPLYADLRGIAPLFIQAGAVETLLDDAVRLAGVAGAADVPVRLDIWPEMIHVWHQFHPMLGAGKRAIVDGATYMRGAMG
jgi:acetyl esterase/lipase